MPRPVVEDNNRISLRIRNADKATILRASALSHSDMTDFILRTALEAAKSVIDQSERLALSERDSLRVLDLLDNPPKPNDRLMNAARALPSLK